jgi:hypothetical protein
VAFQLDAEHSMTCATLAVRCYELERGDLPDTLEQLVPAYLPQVPRDPYDGNPLRYSKRAKRIWSVGEDLVDDGGADRGIDDGTESGDETVDDRTVHLEP